MIKEGEYWETRGGNIFVITEASKTTEDVPYPIIGNFVVSKSKDVLTDILTCTWTENGEEFLPGFKGPNHTTSDNDLVKLLTIKTNPELYL